MVSQVRAEDADLLIMLIHHYSNINHPLYFSTSKGSFDIKNIPDMLTERQRCYLPFYHAFTGCDTVSLIAGQGKSVLFVQGILMSTWTSSLTYRLPRTQ